MHGTSLLLFQQHQNGRRQQVQNNNGNDNNADSNDDNDNGYEHSRAYHGYDQRSIDDDINVIHVSSRQSSDRQYFSSAMNENLNFENIY